VLKGDIRILTAEDLAQVLDRHEQVLEVPEWGGAIKLKAMSLTQRDEMMAKVTDNKRVDGQVDGAKMVRYLCLYGVSEPKLTEEIISTKSWTVIDRIAQAVMRLNGMDQGAALTTSATFRPESGTAVPVPAGEGSGENRNGTP
jgi:hypothetical protein